MHIDLNGIWKYKPLRYTTVTPTGVRTSVEKLPPSGEMMVPCNWEVGGIPNFNGTVEFLREFHLTQIPPDLRAFLVFAGVDYQASVYLNGHFLGEHEGYFQTFEFEVTGKLMEQNQLQVYVDAPMEEPETVWPHNKILIKGIFNHHDARPGGWDLQSGQNECTGGIWGEVYLEFRPRTYVESVRVQTAQTPSGSAFIHVNIRIDSLSDTIAKLDIQLEEIHLTTQVHVRPGLTHVQRVLVVCNPRLWWTWDLGEPTLYTLRVSLESDQRHERSVRFGIRSIAYDENCGTWTLNGKRIFLRGTNVIPNQWLSLYTPEAINKDISLIKACNVNAVRVHAHVNRREFYETCDEAGLLVWQDFPLQWSYAENEDVLSSIASQIQDMVYQLYNHPSIFTWCCHNEPSTNSESMDSLLYQIVCGLDGTRHVHHHSDFKEHPYFGWYWDDYGAYRSAPMGPLVTEFGAQAIPSESVMNRISTVWPPDWDQLAYHNFQWDESRNVAGIDVPENLTEWIRASQGYQARLLKFAVEQYRLHRYEKVGAIFQFMFMDCWPSISWSVVDVDRSPKLGYFALQAAYQPILAVADLQRTVWVPGRHIRIKSVIINDSYHAYPDSHLVISLVGVSSSVPIMTLPVSLHEDSLLGLTEIDYLVPSSLRPGNYKLQLIVKDAGDITLSRNGYAITITSPVP